MDCSRRRILACIACASERCNAIDTLCRNHVHNKLTEGPEPAHSLDADVAHSTKNRSDLSDKAPYNEIWFHSFGSICLNLHPSGRLRYIT